MVKRTQGIMKSTAFVSRNSFEVSGRIVRNAETFNGKNGKVARFSVAHNFGKDMDPLYIDVVMFSKNGKKEVEIPEGLLTKGTAVIVSGFMKPNIYKNEAGKTYRRVDYVALTVQAIAADPAEKEIAEAEAETPAEAEPAPAPAEPKKAPKKGAKKASK